LESGSGDWSGSTTSRIAADPARPNGRVDAGALSQTGKPGVYHARRGIAKAEAVGSGTRISGTGDLTQSRRDAEKWERRRERQGEETRGKGVARWWAA
jgi:hypothetical protein